MTRKPVPFNLSNTQLRSHIARQRVNATIRLAAILEADERHQERVAAQQCKACFYFPSMAGQAFTTQPCACCLVDQTYSNTNTDALCQSCAQAHKLCKHCSADIDMRPGRRSWPDTTTTTTKE